MEHSATILNNLWRAPSKAAELVRVGLLGALLATLAACGGSDAVITNNDLPSLLRTEWRRCLSQSPQNGA